MARTMGTLDAVAVTKTTKPGLYADGGGLYLQVTESGLKTWVYRFMLNGRRRDMGLGRAGNRDVTLAQARDKAADARRLVKAGIDPIEAAKAERAARQVEAVKTKSFKECAEAYITAHEAGWMNPKHISQWRNTLRDYVYPVMGDLPVNAVDTGLVMAVLEPIWASKNETASRVRGRIEAILDWARTRGYRAGENPARWKGHLDHLLPRPSKVKKVKHHAALPYDDMAGFMAELRQQTGTSARALEFTILTAARTSEVLGAKWEEIDLAKKVWTVPASRMKGGREHRVPLSDAALAVLKGMKKGEAGECVFPGSKPKRPLSNMAFLMLLRRMKRINLTGHGFRSTFRDWAAERTAYPAEAAEMALAHVVGDKVEAAYRRGDLFEKRIRLMQDWADFCGSPPATAQVVPLARAG